MPEFSLPHLRHILGQAFVLAVTGQDTGTRDLMLAELGNPDGVGGPTGGVGDPQAFFRSLVSSPPVAEAVLPSHCPTGCANLFPR